MLEQTTKTALKRRAERGSFDPGVVHAILDEGLVCHVGFDVVDDLGQRSPVVLPMSYARINDQLYLHAAVGSRFAEMLSKGMRFARTLR